MLKAVHWCVVAIIAKNIYLVADQKTKINFQNPNSYEEKRIVAS
jgi:hypothetical protein